jgi:hypothetical protein
VRKVSVDPFFARNLRIKAMQDPKVMHFVVLPHNPDLNVMASSQASQLPQVIWSLQKMCGRANLWELACLRKQSFS